MDVLCKGEDIGPWAGEAVDLGARIFHCPLLPSHTRFIAGFGKVLREGGYQIAHNHLDVYSGVPVLMAKRHGTPVICTFHNTDFSKAHPWWLRLPVLEHIRRFYGYFSMGYAIHHADLVTAVSQGVLESIVSGRKTRGCPPEVLYLGVDIPPLATSKERAEFRRSLGFQEDTPLLLHVGRFMELKNHIGLIEIFERVVAEHPLARLLLVGEGILRPSIEQLVSDRGLEQTVRFLGFRDDVGALMARSDVFLLPSLFEGLPIVALEANACGLPVVGSDVPGLVEAREHGAACILRPVGDVEGMAKSVVMLLTRRECARELGMKGRRQIGEFFSVARAAQRLLNLYQRFLSKTGTTEAERAESVTADPGRDREDANRVRDNAH